MIESVCTGFVFGKRPDGTRTFQGPIAVTIISMPSGGATGQRSVGVPGTGLANRATSRERSGA